VFAGSGGACLGNPLEAVRWLARTAVEFGDPLRAGVWGVRSLHAL
jgi:2-keto-4-pentenoate hydratase